MKNLMIDMSIFKAYDIRGVYPVQINEEVAYKIACAYVEFLKKHNNQRICNFVVSSDARLSSPSLREAVVNGILDSGANVIDIGVSTTPAFYFAVGYYGYDGGVQVSASHNPKEFNGLKMVREKAIPISGDTGINEIRDMVVGGNFCHNSANKGVRTFKNGVADEMCLVESSGIDISKIKPMKIVVDVSNAVGAIDVEAMSRLLLCEFVKMNFELDGNFPAHEPDPLKEVNLEGLKKKIIEVGADLGIAVDGDADRYFFIDEKGSVIRQEIIRGIMARIVLAKHPGAKIAYDVRPGKITRDMIMEAGGTPVVTRVGHSLIKEQMLKEDIIYGGESSGHYFYKFDFGTFEAPVVLVFEFLKFISEQGRAVSEIMKPYKRYAHSGEINSKVEDKESKLKLLLERYNDANINMLDGITIEYPDFWFNVRPSNTESLLRLNVEAIDYPTMVRVRDEVLGIILSG